MFIFHIKHGIDEVLASQQPEAVFPAKAREQRAVVRRRLAVQIELGRPPAKDAIFKLDGASEEGIAVLRRTLNVLHGDFEVARLFECRRVGHEIGGFLSCYRGTKDKSTKCQNKT